jgi:methionyl aminopeptidase
MREVCKVSYIPPRCIADTDDGQLGREILDITAAAIKPGITTDELDVICHQATIKRNAYPSPLNYRKFPKSICT